MKHVYVISKVTQYKGIYGKDKFVLGVSTNLKKAKKAVEETEHNFPIDVKKSIDENSCAMTSMKNHELSKTYYIIEKIELDNFYQIY